MGLIIFALSVLVKIYLSALDYMTIQSINKRCQPIFSQFETVLQTTCHLGRELWRLVGPWYCFALYLIWLVLLAFLCFHSLCWEPISRLVFPIIPLILATGWSSLHLLCGLFLRSYSLWFSTKKNGHLHLGLSCLLAERTRDPPVQPKGWASLQGVRLSMDGSGEMVERQRA